MKKFNNETFDERIQNRPIKRLDEYIGANIPITFICLQCNYKWITTPNSVLQGTGCSVCATQKTKLTNLIIDNRLMDRTIKRLGEYVSMDNYLSFQCLVCNYIWKAITRNVIFLNRGCPKCGKSMKLSRSEIDEQLTFRHIKMLGEYINSHTPSRFQCLLDGCSNIWTVTPYNILYKGKGCPACNSFFKNEKLILSLFQEHKLLFKYHFCIRNIDTDYQYKYSFDFYFPDIKTAIEYNGHQHYKPVCFGGISFEKAKENFEHQIQRDQNKLKFCANNSINIIIIDGREYSDIKLSNYIIETIIPLIRKCQEDGSYILS